MNKLISSAINSIVSTYKRLHLERVFVPVLAGLLLFVNTACSQTSPPAANRGQDAVLRSTDSRTAGAPSSPYRGQAQQKELYDPIQPRKGGMNGYNDDFKQDSADTKARTEDLINRSKQNLQKRAENPGDLLENYKDNPIGEGVSDLSRNVGNAAEELRENLSEGAEKGVRNIRENAANFREDAPRIFEQAGRNAQGATQDLQEGATNLSKGVQRAADRASDFVQDRS